MSPDSFQSLKTRYDKIIAKYPENHTQSDFHYYRATHVRSIKEKGWVGYLYIARNRAWHIIDQWFLYIVALIAPLMIFVLLLRHVDAI